LVILTNSANGSFKVSWTCALAIFAKHKVRQTFMASAWLFALFAVFDTTVLTCLISRVPVLVVSTEVTVVKQWVVWPSETLTISQLLIEFEFVRNASATCDKRNAIRTASWALFAVPSALIVPVAGWT
jgi:hypothetical protein